MLIVGKKVRIRTGFIIFLCFFLSLPELFGQNREKYWVFFKDKQISSLAKAAEMRTAAKSRISKRALTRRKKVQTPNRIIDEHDFPVSENYLNSLKSQGYEPLVVSNWLNAASFWLDDSDVSKLQTLNFVKAIRPVARAIEKPRPEHVIPAPAYKREKPGAHKFDYGFSFIQNELINVPAVHDLGITGNGVWVGMLDTGFKHRGHEAFDSLKVIAEYDFINNDDVTENQGVQDDFRQHNHGTETLGTIAGFQNGKLIGPAFDASFLLAKTEILTEEIPQEEDNWVAGIEWMENMGVDVVSSSLGYLDFYEPSDMDGNTAVTTIAADLAVSRGVVVVNSAGNERDTPWHIIIAPADGDSVIAVGAVTSQGELTYFSSVGPTADGRIKPDVVAMGSAVYTAAPSLKADSSSYVFVDGTSFSCPSTAGVAALILSAHPNLTPVQVRDALRETADRAANPDTLYGWGLVNAYAAVLYHGPAFSNLPEMNVDNHSNLEVKIKVASKFGIDPNQVSLFYASQDGNFNRKVDMLRGTEDNQFSALIPELAQGDIHFYFQAVDSSGVVALHPFNAPDSTFTFSFPDDNEIPNDFVLEQNYPNPFNGSTTIVYKLTAQARVTMTIYNLLGQKIITLVDGTKPSGNPQLASWDGKDASGKPAPSGIYFYKLKIGNSTQTRKMLLIR